MQGNRHRSLVVLLYVKVALWCLHVHPDSVVIGFVGREEWMLLFILPLGGTLPCVLLWVLHEFSCRCATVTLFVLSVLKEKQHDNCFGFNFLIWLVSLYWILKTLVPWSREHTLSVTLRSSYVSPSFLSLWMTGPTSLISSSPEWFLNPNPNR